MHKKLFIVIPAFNEEKSLGTVLKRLKKGGYTNIIVVDDGSEDKTASIATKHGVYLYQHAINRGLGGALGTGIAAAVQNGAELVVTFDADGQHAVNDIEKVVRPIIKKRADVVIGSRLKNPEGMPLIRRIGNRGFNVITFILFGVWTTDSQSGLRAFSRHAAKKIEIRANRMEVSSDIIREIGEKKLKLREVPIQAIYTEYSLAHGENSVKNGFKILAKLVLRKLMR